MEFCRQVTGRLLYFLINLAGTFQKHDPAQGVLDMSHYDVQASIFGLWHDNQFSQFFARTLERSNVILLQYQKAFGSECLLCLRFPPCYQCIISIIMISRHKMLNIRTEEGSPSDVLTRLCKVCSTGVTEFVEAK